MGKGVGNRSKAEHESETILSNYITDDKTEIKIHIKSNGTPKSANTSGPTSANPSDTERGEDDKDQASDQTGIELETQLKNKYVKYL